MRILLVLFASLVAVLFADDQCNTGFLSNGDDPTDNTWFCVRHYNITANYPDAKKFCESQGATMVSVHRKIQDESLTIFDQYPTFWIGGRDVYNNGTWSWEDGTKWDYSSWAAGAPYKGLGWDCIMHSVPLDSKASYKP
ncbi:hypothetical protein QR680_014634 [Steinernema hermaphroditum]|uniref:C-type lectin domain-containing protein n=1 Tax=Steinernema hermaphroditum TaxID=289476 RepID=A0AA39M4A1_9BILA|nr:hypothetical protein QR680_014634 [Steinernema hermaphroditum]